MEKYYVITNSGNVIKSIDAKDYKSAEIVCNELGVDIYNDYTLGLGSEYEKQMSMHTRINSRKW